MLGWNKRRYHWKKELIEIGNLHNVLKKQKLRFLQKSTLYINGFCNNEQFDPICLDYAYQLVKSVVSQGKYEDMLKLLTLQRILSEQPSSNLHKSLSISQGLLMLKKNNSCLIEQLTVIALFTVVILFILCARKSRLYFVVGKKKILICYFHYFFAGLHPPKYFSRKNC